MPCHPEGNCSSRCDVQRVHPSGHRKPGRAGQADPHRDRRHRDRNSTARRRRPLETEIAHLPGGEQVVVPTLSETLRVKGYLIVKRNQVRDYLDVAAIADSVGPRIAAQVLAHIDDYYEDLVHEEGPVATQLTVQLAQPEPRDHSVIAQLTRYKGLARRWHAWSATCTILGAVAQGMLDAASEDPEGR